MDLLAYDYVVEDFLYAIHISYRTQLTRDRRASKRVANLKVTCHQLPVMALLAKLVTQLALDTRYSIYIAERSYVYCLKCLLPINRDIVTISFNLVRFR